MAIAPAFILIFSISYYYLCAHSIATYVRFLDEFYNCYYDKIIKHNMSYLHMHSSFKLRDVTGVLNIYAFRTGINRSKDKTIPTVVNKIADFFINLLIVLSLMLPAAVYAGIARWLWSHTSEHVNYGVGLMIVVFYVLMMSVFIFGPLFFYFRVKPSRDRFIKTIQSLMSKSVPNNRLQPARNSRG